MNKITSILGLILILAATFSVFYLDKVTWWDALAGILAGITLIYTKNNKAVEAITNVITGIKK